MKPERRRGAAAVEFAMCVPVLILVLFGIIEFSRLVQIQHAVREAALEGARTGVTLDATVATTQSKATATLSSIGIINPTITVTPNPLTYTATTVSVTVSVDPSGNSWFMKFLAAGNPIQATVSLDREIQAVSVPGP
jgi:Flp pilus assembly protein TadG